MYPLVDRILGGTLDEQIASWRGEGLSAADIAFRLRTDHNVTVSVATVSRWVRATEAAS